MKNQAEEVPSPGTTNSRATNEDITSVEETNTPIRHRHHRRNHKHHEENHSHHKNHNKHHGIRTRYGLWHKSPKWNRPFDTLASNIIGK